MLQDRQQMERGVEGIPRPSMPIGHRLTGEIRNAFMSLWQSMHLRTLAEEGYRIGTRDQKCSLVIKKVNLITMKVPDLGDWISVQLQVKLDRDFDITVPAVPCVRRNVLSYMNHKKQTIDYLANNHNPCGVLVTKATIMSHQLDKLFFTPAHRWKCFFIRELRAGWKETLVVSAGQVGHWNPVLFHEHRNAAEKRPFPMQDIREVFCQLLGLENVPDLNKAMIQRFREVLADHFPEGQSARDHVENCLLCTRSLAKGSLAHRVCQMMGFEGDASHSCLLRLRAVTVLCRMRHQAVTVLC
ncbi:hypothetical protein EBZ37_07815, partial [bacterium]|nr:hypothetical protein [bacterium]